MIDVSSYNGTVNWKKVKDQKINHAMLKIGSGINKNKKGAKTVSLAQTSVMQDMQRFIVEFIIILMQGQSMMRRKKQSTVSVC